jgi:4-oxalomesaconate tautomerase
MEGLGIGDARQLDGLGGGTSLTSKVAIVSLSANENAHLDYYFIQIMIGKGAVSSTQTCGNILAGVLPFAIETGMIKATLPTTSARINIVNTGGICEVVVQTPNGKIEYAGDAKIDGVFGTASPIICNYIDTAGATCGALFPTQNKIDIIDNQKVTCIDNGMPIVAMRASDFDISGNETKAVLDANATLKQRLESIRLQAGYLMNLGDVSQQAIPKMCLISPATQGGLVNTRMFIPHVCHDAIGVLAAVSVATACIFNDTITSDFVVINPNETAFSIEHPTGEMTVNLSFFYENDVLKIEKSGVLRTARLISKGEVFV